MIETIQVTEVKGKMSKTNKPYYTITGSNGKEIVKGNCFDEKCLGIEGKKADFDIKMSGDYRNYTLVQVHESNTASDTASGTASSTASSDKHFALMAACTYLSGMDKLGGKDVKKETITSIADYFAGWLSSTENK